MITDTVTVVVTAHEDVAQMADALRCVALQTWPEREVILLACCIPQLKEWWGVDPEPCMEDYGHAKRAKGLQLARGDWVLFWNADDHYHPDALRLLVLGARESGADIVACDWVPKFAPRVRVPSPRVGSITSGNFIARRELAQRVGYNHRHYEADGRFIEDLVAAGASFHRIGLHPSGAGPLYTHR